MWTKRWLSQKCRHELVSIDLMNASTECTTSSIQKRLILVWPTTRCLSHWLCKGRKTGFLLSEKRVRVHSSIFRRSSSPCEDRKSILTRNLPDGSKSTQKSFCCGSERANSSSNAIVVLALKTSSRGALWNTVMPSVDAFSTSCMNSSFQTGSNVFCLILERSGRWEKRDVMIRHSR